MTTQGVPGQPGVVPAEGCESGRGEPAPLEVLAGVGLLDPARSAGATDPVVHSEREVSLCRVIGGALTPAATFTGDRVLPRTVQPRHLWPTRRPAETPAGDPLKEFASGLPAGCPSHLVCRRDEPANQEVAVGVDVRVGATRHAG